MRRTVLALLLTLALLAGCTKKAPPPTPKPEGVALANLDLKGAPVLAVSRVPAPEGNGPAPDLTDIAFATAQDGFAVTRSGLIERTHDGGASWSRVYAYPGARFSRVEVVDTQTIFAIAEPGCDPGPNCEGPVVLLRSTDGGDTWASVEPKLPPLNPPSVLEGTQAFSWLTFQFVSAQVGYAAGDLREAVLLRAPPLMVTRDGGETWQVVALPEGMVYSYGFSFTSPDQGYVTARRTGDDEHSVVLATQDGGRRWRILYETSAIGLYAVHFPTPADGYIGGGLNPKLEAQPRAVVLATHDGGATWSEVSRVEDHGSPVVDLRMVSPTDGWAMRGGCWSMGGNGPCGGELSFTRDGGKTWVGTGRSGERIRSFGPRAWAVDGTGGASTLWRTEDGGATWQQLARPDALRVSHVQFLSPQVGLIGTNLGLYRTLDCGRSWAPYGAAGPGPSGNWPMFLDGQTALRVDRNDLERSTNGGHSWQQVPVPLPARTDHISMPALGTAAASPDEAWLAMESLSCMGAECPAFLLHSSDGGTTWQHLEPGPPMKVRQLAFADSHHGAGITWNNRLLLTADGGRHWTLQTGPQNLSLYQGTYAGGAGHLWLSGADWADDGIGPGFLLHSVDGGATWRSWTTTGIPFQELSFASAQEGWAVADEQDGSGLLVTRDGGQTWTEVWPAR